MEKEEKRKRIRRVLRSRLEDILDRISLYRLDRREISNILLKALEERLKERR